MSLELGRLVQQRRHELGLSRRELAERSDMSYPYVSQIETGDRDPSLKTLRKLAEVLEVQVDELARLVASEGWLTSTSSLAGMAVAPSSLPPSRASLSSFEDSLELYREKVLPSVERKLQSVPPLMRLQLLAELTERAAREAADGH